MYLYNFLVVGDFGQLPPIGDRRTLIEHGLIHGPTFHLIGSKRTDDESLLNLLDNMRNGRATAQMVKDTIKKHEWQDMPPSKLSEHQIALTLRTSVLQGGPIVCFRNSSVTKINQAAE